MKKLRRIKIRYIAAVAVIITSILITPACIESAYQFRGYMAYGSEYLVVPMGFITAAVILEIAKSWDKFIYRKRKIQETESVKEWEHGRKEKEKIEQEAHSVWQDG